VFFAFFCIFVLLTEIAILHLSGQILVLVVIILLSARISGKLYRQASPNFLCMFIVVVARSYSGGVALMFCVSGFVDNVMF